MNKAQEFLKERGINPIEPIYWDIHDCAINAKNSFSRVELKDLLETYHESRVKAIFKSKTKTYCYKTHDVPAISKIKELAIKFYKRELLKQ